MNLPAEQQEQIKEWLLEHTLDETVGLLAKAPPDGLGIPVGRSVLGRYRQRVMPAYLATLKMEEGDALAEAMSGKFADRPEFKGAALASLKQQLLKLSMGQDLKPLDVARLYRVLAKDRDQDLAREKFEYDVVDAIIKNFDKISASMPKKKRDPKALRIARDKIRLRVFGCLTDAEEPLTGRDYEPGAPSTPLEDEEEKPTFEEMVEEAADGKELTEPERKWGPWGPPMSLEAFKEKYPDRPYDPYPEIEVGNAVIMEPEKPFQDPNPIPPLYFERESSRECNCRNAQDSYGSYCTFEYEDGFNPHGVNTKYVYNASIGKHVRRDEP